MVRNCDWCGQEFTARRSSGRFCGDTCRKRHQRGPKPPPNNGQFTAPAANGSIAETIRAELAHLGLDATTPGTLALDLAERIASPTTSDASRAPMAKELMRLRADLLRTKVDEDDPVFILQKRMQAKQLIAMGRIEEGQAALAFWMAKWSALPESVRNPNATY